MVTPNDGPGKGRAPDLRRSRRGRSRPGRGLQPWSPWPGLQRSEYPAWRGISGAGRKPSWPEGRCLESGVASREEEPVAGPRGLNGRGDRDSFSKNINIGSSRSASEEAPALPAGNRSTSPCKLPVGNSTSSTICRRDRRRADQPTVIIFGPSPPLVKRILEKKPALPRVGATSPKPGCFGLAPFSPK
jgi:hypothetical protein